ncbi:survival factor 1 [[Candida] railenensis]|uniref:Survival factor 1 n=1 Tax=[Candida] railenensis TaxID=45579 RepID=A0A9P0QPF7_9ASCO|nr:survival factor 1 [[Candida] railenensis]
MFKWIQGGLSAAIGTAEPEYGREAIQSVIDSIEKKEAPIYRETTVEDFAWKNPENTNVETQSFYFTCLKTGLVGFAQVIHSNVVGQTAQFTFRLFNFENGKPEEENLWTSTKLEDFKVDGPNFYATGLSIKISEDGQTYHLKSEVNPESIVDLTVTKLVPGVIFGKDGVSNYGEDPAEPWGNMRHLFWPRCKVTGTIKHKEDKVLEIDGYTMFVMAIQGMKPHHAAKAWNFLNFQNENYSAVQMEFTTPPSYGNTKVNIGLVTDNEKILLCSVNNKITHITPLSEESTPVTDSVGWPVPSEIVFEYDGDLTTNDKSKVVVKGELKTLVERVDVMAELPQFIKDIATGVSGTKPYIYQFCNKLEIDVDGKKEDGIAFNEVTFISE